MKTLFTTVAATAALFAVAHSASAAGLSGDTIGAQYFYPDSATVFQDLGSFVAPGGGNLSGNIDYSVTDDQVIFTNVTGGTSPFQIASFNGFKFTDLTRDPHITGVTLDASTTANGVSASDASWTSNQLSFNFEGEVWQDRQQAVFDISFAVPEPATWAIMLVGLGATGAALRSRRRRFAV